MEKVFNILYLDKDQKKSALFCDLFKDNHNVFSAATVAEGREILKDVGPIDIVICDLMMNETSGVEFLTEMFEQNAIPIRILMSRSNTLGAIVLAVNQAHIYSFIVKPWTEQQMKLRIDEAVNSLVKLQSETDLVCQLVESNEQMEGILSGRKVPES